MKNNEFKALINNVTDKVARAYAAADCDKLTQVGDYLYDYRKENPDRFTARQNELIENIFGDINVKIAELDGEFYEVDDREELAPHNPEIMDDETFSKFYDRIVGEFDNCETIEEVDEANDFFNREIDAGVIVLTNAQAAKCADVVMARRYAIAHPQKATKKGKVTSKMSKKKEAPADVQPAQTPEQPETAPAPVEVLKGEVIETKNEAEINAALGRISTVIEKIGRGYLEIVGDVARLRKYEAWKLTGHKNLYELCADKFGMSKGSVHNLEVVFKKYGDPETFQLTDACAGMSLRQMLDNIDAEKKAIAGEVAGEAAYGDGNGGEAASGKKTKAQTLIDVSYELAGDDWNVDAILDEIRKQLEQNPEAKEAFPDGASVKFTITI